MADMDGIDAFCCALLYKIQRPTMPEALWLPALVELVAILQYPQAKHALPESSELAVGFMDDPTVSAAMGSRRERVEALMNTGAETFVHTTVQPTTTPRRRPLFDTLRSLAHRRAVILPETPSGRVDLQGREVRHLTGVQQAMTPIEDVFMLSIDAVLDFDLFFFVV
ncbi:hypothetical protein MKEN_01244000 [Mycena kentingensis (nom. inval.)]|nr:hypothetical protein MKEN_01244000 [Mycena kentingensis (nom. inval.)]